MKPVLYILCLISLILFQTTLLEEVTILGIKPDLALIVVYFFGIFGGEVRGVMTGLALGYFMDLLSGGVWGIHLVTKLTLGFLAGLLGRTLINMSVIFTGVIIALSSIIQGLVFLFVSYTTSEPEDLLVFLSQIMLPQAIYDGGVGSCLFWFLSRRFLPKQSTAQEWLRNPALSALGRGNISSTRVEKKA